MWASTVHWYVNKLRRVLTTYLSIIMHSKTDTFLTFLHCYLLVSRGIFLHLPLLERLWRQSSHKPFHVVQQIHLGGLLSLIITAYSEMSRYLEIGPIIRALQSIASAGQQSPSYPTTCAPTLPTTPAEPHISFTNERDPLLGRMNFVSPSKTFRSQEPLPF